jgi:tryptophanyl-tRNA synthetase
VGKLGDMIQYKEKKGAKETGNLALLSYPVLMAADIFLYDPDLVIVGQDQKQHLELTKDIAKNFNNFCGKELLKIPKFEIPKFGAKIMGLKDPTKKMSKSENDYISLLDEPKEITKKIMRALTDSNQEKISYEPEKRKGISNLLTIYALLNNEEIEEAEENLGGLNHYQFKLKIIDLLNEKLGLIQEKYNKYFAKIDILLNQNKNELEIQAKEKLILLKKELKI